MKIITNPSESELSMALQRPVSDLSKLEKSVKKIIKQVQNKGDKALIELTQKYDGAKLDNLCISKSSINDSERFLTTELKNAMKLCDI